MEPHLDKILSSVEKPEILLAGTHGENLAVRYFSELMNGVYLVVAYRVSNAQGFIITGFPMKDVGRLRRRRRVVWELRRN